MLASAGILQVAFSAYGERYLLDVVEGHVMQFESGGLAKLLNTTELDIQTKAFRDLLKSEALYVFDDLFMMFWCFNDLQENPE